MSAELDRELDRLWHAVRGLDASTIRALACFLNAMRKRYDKRYKPFKCK